MKRGIRMGFNRISTYVLLLALGALTACGGGNKDGGGEVGNDPNATTVLSVTLDLRDAANNETTHFAAGQTFTGVAKVLQTVTATGPAGPYTSTRIAANVPVQFALDGTHVLFPESGRVLTDGDGKARIQVTLGNTPGAYTLTADASALNATSAQAAQSFSVDQTLEPDLTLRILDAQGNLTNLLRAGSTYTVQATVTQVVTDLGNPGSVGTPAPAPDVLVTFASDGGEFDPTNGQMLTDQNGVATAQFSASLLNGGFVMAATAVADERPVSDGVPYQVRIPRLTLGSGTPFVGGVLALDPAQISAGGSSSVTAELRDETGALFLPPAEVMFHSDCSVADAATVTSPVLSSAGKVVSRYVAGAGCYGADVIHAEVLLPGATVAIQAQATIGIDDPVGSGIIFVSNEPGAIVVRGRGTPTTPESAVVTFKVTDPAGLPVPGATVQFALTAALGEAELQPASSISSGDGTVTTRLIAGRVTGSTSVLATVVATGAQTQSAPITISNGRPTQDGVSLSAESLNIEAFAIDGVEDQITVRMVDRNSNPVPDGTNVRFIANGGAISPQCSTSAGACTVSLTSQTPRPSDGRIALLATSVGDESFTDRNGNGLFDQGEPFDDLPEPFLDEDEDGHFDVGEPFVDTDLNGIWSSGNHAFDGADCQSGCGLDATTVRKNAIIVFSTSGANIQFQPGTIPVTVGSVAGFNVLVSDNNGNMMAPGTTVALEGTNVTLSGETSFTLADTNARGPFYITGILEAPADPGTGLVTARVISPSGVQTTRFATVQINAVAATGQVAGKDSVEVVPAAFEVASGSQSRVVTHIVASTNDGRGKVALGGAMPQVSCVTTKGENLHVQSVGTQQPTALNGVGASELRIDAGMAAGSEAVCRVSVGNGAAFVSIAVK